MCARCCGIIDAPVAGKLIGLLAMFAAALTIALPGQAAVAAVRLAHLAQREREIDAGENVIDAVALLFGAARGQNHRGGRFSQKPCRQPAVALPEYR